MEVQAQFREIVENIFNRWTALKLAVEHGMAGQNGLQVKILTRARNFISDDLFLFSVGDRISQIHHGMLSNKSESR